MKQIAGWLTICLLITVSSLAQTTGLVNFDDNWRFHAGGCLAAEQTSFNDSSWRKIDLPHDWSIEDIPGTTSPFNALAISQVGGGFTRGGTGWYRKTFSLPYNAAGNHVVIQFDGVYMNADVWVNGQHLRNHPYGYTSFWYDITEQLKMGGPNTIAVEVKNEGQNSRWYSGSGIYRHVWLKIVEPVHIAQWGTFITTPVVSEAAASVHISTQLINESHTAATLNVITRLLNTAGSEAARIETAVNLGAGETKTIHQQEKIINPQLWSCDAPVLYKAVTEVYENNQVVNTETNSFGIRKISFDVYNGFQLNGKTIKLKGGCFHNDNGPLGARAYDRAEERKVALLKACGYNAIRCSHNPPSPAFLDACDRLGMLVMDEAFDTWNYGKNAYDYHLYFKEWWKDDITSMVLRDRNHPAVIMWSIGNEIDESGNAEGAKTALMLAQFIKSLDTTRAITSAVNSVSPAKDPYFAALDVAGYNYAANGDHSGESIYESDHKRVPARIMVGTESYPLDAFDSWMYAEKLPYIIGDFVWTAFDYIGEASIGWLGYPQNSNFYPWNLAFCGDIDICGWKRPQSYYRDAMWKPNQLSVFVKPPQPSFKPNPAIEPWSRWNWLDAVAEWNWAGNENKPIEVSVYSSCEKAELFLNGKSLGIKPTNASTKFIASWAVPYQAGELKAVGYNGDGNTPVQTAALHTASAPVKIELTADQTRLEANGQDLSYITVELKDSKGFVNPTTASLVKFEVSGDAEIVGVGNANPMSTESYGLSQRKAWKGKCIVIIKAGHKPGNIILKARTEGLKTAQLNLVAV